MAKETQIKLTKTRYRLGCLGVTIKAGKPPKVALTALMRKLIELANSLIKANRSWVMKEA
jgi:hypothetical protein